MDLGRDAPTARLAITQEQENKRTREQGWARIAIRAYWFLCSFVPSRSFTHLSALATVAAML
jgi:hypothetical protein